MTQTPISIQIAIGRDIALLLGAQLQNQIASTGGKVTIVMSSPAEGVRTAIQSLVSVERNVALFDASRKRWIFDEVRLLSSRREAVNVDAIAPRLREVRLPTSILDADTVVAIVDVRADNRSRPDVSISLWASLASPRHRIAARFTGARDGLTAEIALARPPDSIVCIDCLWPAGPVTVTSTPDVIAAEVMALAIRDLRSTSESIQNGPWEDELVQRATEIGLGCSGPSSLEISGEIEEGIADDLRARAIDQVHTAAARAGVGLVTWH